MEKSARSTSPAAHSSTLSGWIKDALLTIYVFIFMHTFYLGVPIAMVAFPVYVFFWWETYWWLSIVYTVAYVVFTFDGSEKRIGRYSYRLTTLWVFQLLFKWFPCKLTRSKAAKGKSLDPKKQYIFAMHPHGMLALGRVTLTMMPDAWNRLFPGIKKRILAASAPFYIPFYREIWLATECVDASRETAEYCLSDEGGRFSLCLYPGGEREQLLTQTHKYRLFLKHRKGFVKLALSHGTPLVPVLVFGETSLYNALDWVLGEFRIWMSIKTRVSLPLFTGRFFGLPHRVPLTGVVGAPIDVPRIQHPTDEEVSHYHALYVKELTKMFEEEKGLHGYPDAELEIL